MYAVMKLLTEIEVATYPEPTTYKLGGCAGYLPVYNTIEEAQKMAGDKYEIVAIRQVKEPDVRELQTLDESLLHSTH